MLSNTSGSTRRGGKGPGGAAAMSSVTPGQISARIDRLPASRHLATTVARIGLGGWFEFYELFMAGYIALGLMDAGLFGEESKGYFDLHGYASFTASFFTGMFFSTALLSRLSDRYGRRAVFTASMLGYSAAAVLIAFSTSAAWIDIWRFVAGFAIGIQLINNDTYMSEICPAPVRGRYMSAGYIVILTSVPVVALLSWQLVPRSPLGLDGWRWVMLFGALGGVVVFLLRRRLPESPRWLADQGRLAEADEVVRQLEKRVAAETGQPLPEPARESAPPEAEPAGTGGWREVFGRRYGARTALLSVFQFAQTIAVYGFANWAPILLVHRGFSIVHSLTYSFMIALLTPVGALVATLLSGRMQRKWQLVGAAIGIGAFGMLFAAAHSTALVLIGGAGISLCNNWLIGAFHPYSSELFPTRIRSRALGFSYSWSRISSVFVSYWIAALLVSYGTGAVFVMIGVAMAVIVLSVGVFGPRTDGRTLEDISP